MSKLSERVKKAKGLWITQGGYHFNTWGTDNQLYYIKLSSEEKEIITPDGFITIKLFKTDCQKVVLNGNKTDARLCDCSGNIEHTVCYHTLGCIWKSLKDAGKQVSFYSTYRNADRALTFGGFLAKVENNNGKGAIWCIVRKEGDTKKIREVNLLPRHERRNAELMRDPIGFEGID